MPGHADIGHILCIALLPTLLIYRWYHMSITSSEAEALLLSKGQDGSFLVHSSYQSPGHCVLCARVDEQVSHINIRNKDGVFDVEYGPKFDSLTHLIECYQKRPIVETSGSVISLKHPCLITSFFPDNIFQRVCELQKRIQDVYGKTGFWEEFQVCVCVLLGGGGGGGGVAEVQVQRNLCRGVSLFNKVISTCMCASYCKNLIVVNKIFVDCSIVSPNPA